MTRIDQIMRELPPELQQEVVDFARFLLEKRQQKYGRKLRQDWAGALKEYRTQYTSLALQKKPLNGVVTERCFLSTQMYGLSDSLIRIDLQRWLCLRPTVWTDQESLSERSRYPGYPH